MSAVGLKHELKNSHLDLLYILKIYPSLNCGNFSQYSPVIIVGMYACRMKSAVDLSVHPFKPQDRKGSFTTHPQGNVPGYKKVIKGLTITTTSMLAQYQQGSCGLFGWWGKTGVPREKTLQACTEQAKPYRHN